MISFCGKEHRKTRKKQLSESFDLGNQTIPATCKAMGRRETGGSLALADDPAFASLCLGAHRRRCRMAQCWLMSLILLLWCAFAVIVVVLVGHAFQLDRALKRELLAREAIEVELAALHEIDMAARLQKHPEVPAAEALPAGRQLQMLHF